MADGVATAVRERPVIFSGPEVKAILAGTKTQFRRAVRPQPEPDFRTAKEDGGGNWIWWSGPDRPGLDEFTKRAYPRGEGIACPFGRPGDRLWVRETWAVVHCSEEEIDDWPTHRAIPAFPPGMGWQAWHRAGHPYDPDCLEDRGFRWRSPLHMPRWASRLTLEIKEVRVQRVQDIEPRDAWGEGARCTCLTPVPACKGNIGDFRTLWDETHAKRGFGWPANPWIWAITFAVVPPAEVQEPPR